MLHAATDREKRKTTKYKALATEEGSAFVPFVMETYGGFGPKAGRFLGELVRRASHSLLLTLSAEFLRLCYQSPQRVFGEWKLLRPADGMSQDT